MRLSATMSLFAPLLLAAAAHADVKLPPFFSDHLVLQRETQVPIWGTAAAGEKVTVRFRDQEKSTTAGADGKWRVELDPLQVGQPGELTVAGKNMLTLQDVLVGEVWVGSGQSNMQGATRSYAVNDAELARLRDGGPYPQIRLGRANGNWQVATPQNIDGFSAILFAFGQTLQKELDVPVGLLVGAVGGTPSGAWLSERSLAEDAPCQALIAEYAKSYDAALKRYESTELPAWEKAAAEAKAAGKPEPRKPEAPIKPGLTRGNQKPGYLYEAHIRPLVGYAVRGVLWDQGESGTAIGGVDQYTLMGALIRGWRHEWGRDFAFIYVQKPSGGGCAWDTGNPITSHAEPFAALPAQVPADGAYVETHVRIMTYPHVGMAISSDLGPGVHPVNKSGYGRRAAAVALGMTYQKPVEYYGPVYASHAVEGNKLRVKFTHVGQGLATRHGDKLQGFAIAGDDGKFHWGQAQIDGDSVVVSSPEVPKPAHLRYAWSNKRTWANLFNADGLPALPFRTDKELK
ncbi:MAG: sialate O-acetylesterase [Pirellulaceae bacterium]|nr:sialate O-acetylesterase [Pirellulaceae bacterium]